MLEGLGGLVCTMLNLPRIKSFLLAALVLLAVAFLAGACQTREKGRKPSADWSRSVPVGVLVRGDIDMIAGSQEEQLTHMVWLQEEDDQFFVHYVQLDASTQPLVDRHLDLPEAQLRRPQLLETAGPNLHLLWSSRVDGRREWDLLYGQISPAGDLTGEIKEIVTADADVNDFTIAPDGQGGLYVAWESDADGALYGAQISAAGEVVQEPALLVRQGESPFLSADGEALSLVWFDEGNMQYERWPDGRLAEGTAETVAAITLGTGQTLDGPVLGIAGEWAYVLWSVYSSSGLEAGTAVAKYIAFPKDAPVHSDEQTIRVSSAEETPYAPFESAYQISQLAPPAAIRESSGLVRQPDPSVGRGDELAVAVVVDQESRLDVITQVGLLLFKEGAFAGYQMAGKTDAFSQEPVLAGDAVGKLYHGLARGRARRRGLLRLNDGRRAQNAGSHERWRRGQHRLKRWPGSYRRSSLLSAGLHLDFPRPGAHRSSASVARRQ